MKIFGYPMDYVQNEFTDIVSRMPVNRYLFKGQWYMAESRWSLFKVKMAREPESSSQVNNQSVGE